MPHNVHNIHINGNCQDFILTSLNFNEENSKLTFSFVSKKETSKVICPYCGKSHCMINDCKCHNKNVEKKAFKKCII